MQAPTFALLRLATIVLAAAAASAAANGGPTHAPIVVTRFDDPRPPDACTPTDCSFREAIILANSVPGHDTVRLPAGTYLQDLGHGDPAEWYEDSSYLGDLDITDDLTIAGAGSDLTAVTQSPGLAERGLDVQSGASSDIRDLAVENLLGGAWPGTDCGRGIRSSGSLTLNRVTIANNIMRGSGGGICNDGGTLIVRDSTISHNCACFIGWGGGILTNGTTVLERVIVEDNIAHMRTGGGISGGGSLTIIDSAIIGNDAAGDIGESRGGGISAGGTIALTNVTLSGNHTDGEGVDRNSPEVLDSRGAGASLFGNVTLTNVTIIDNESETTGGGIYYGGTGTLTLVNTIISGNTGGDCEGAITSGGHNIDGDGSCGLGAAGDLPGVDPLLGPLAENGGPSQTHALLAGSPAIDAGDGTACPAGDQRGYARPAGTACDIGAYEYQALLPSPTTSPSPTPTWAPIARGDADCDDDIDPVDALAALRLTAGLGTDAGCLLAANVDCSLAVDSVDALFILRYAAALPVTLPPGCPAIGE